MKILRPCKLAAPLAIAALLAAMTMGNLTLCDAILVASQVDADTLRVTVQAGQTKENIANNVYESYLFRLCPPGVVPGIYPVIHIPAGRSGFNFVDLATSSTSPPGHYFVGYVESYLNFPYNVALELAFGVLDLTITPNPNLAVACFHAEAEIFRVGVPVTFDASCSQGPIVLYKWWFNYNNNPASQPSTTSTGPTIQTTYTSAGERTVRLVVRSASGEEAENSHTYAVQAYAVEVAP